MKHWAPKIAIILPLIFLLVACGAYQSSFVKTSFKALEVSKTSYETARSIANDLYVQGKITEEKKVEIETAAKSFAKAHNAAVEALAKYRETKTLESQELAEKQVLLASSALADLLNILKPYLLKE